MTNKELLDMAVSVSKDLQKMQESEDEVCFCVDAYRRHMLTGIEKLAEAAGQPLCYEDDDEFDYHKKYFIYDGIEFFQLRGSVEN